MDCPQTISQKDDAQSSPQERFCKLYNEYNTSTDS
jgi:hypothetical protein